MNNGVILHSYLFNKIIVLEFQGSGARRKAPYSPRMARRKVEMERIHPHKEERRKTLAELAVEAGYKVSCLWKSNSSF